MDIISELLETDRLAEEKLENARARRIKLLEECEKQINEIRSQAEREIEEYRNKKLSDSQKDTGEREVKLKEDERAKIAAFEELYKQNHEQWEHEIVANVTGI